MDFERLFNKEPLPAYEDLRGFIGVSVKGFDKIVEFIEGNYDFDKEICFGGKKFGVMVRFRKNGKTLISIFPEKNNFSCVLIYGKKEIAQFENRKNEFSDYLTKVFDDTKQYPDGKWMLIRTENEKYADEFIEMIKIKKKPKKKQ